MLLDATAAIVPSEKLRDYLLSSVHPIGRYKSSFFRSLGYSQDQWQVGGFGLMLFSWLPYIALAAILKSTRNALIAVCGAIPALLFDLFMFNSVFIRPGSSTAAVGLLFAPFWNLLIFAPLGAGIGWVISRRGATG